MAIRRNASGSWTAAIKQNGRFVGSKTFKTKREGRSMPLPQLERRVMPFMDGADYLGPEMNGQGTVRMKFIRNGRVIWVDVDPRTGRIIQRSKP